MVKKWAEALSGMERADMWLVLAHEYKTRINKELPEKKDDRTIINALNVAASKGDEDRVTALLGTHGSHLSPKWLEQARQSAYNNGHRTAATIIKSCLDEALREDYVKNLMASKSRPVDKGKGHSK